MRKTGTVIARLVMVAAPAALGAAAILFANDLRQLPDSSANAPQLAPVRVITLEPTQIVPRVSGYGTVAPVREWTAVARVEGEITEIAQPLAPGHLVAQDTVLFRIDQTDLKLDLASIDAQLAASRVKDDTVQASLALAQSDLDLAQAELARQEQLAGQKVVAQATLDTSRRQELTARAKVTELRSQITLNAAERDVLTTQRAALERALGLTEIRAPYDLRVSTLGADLGQYVGRGQSLMTGEDVAAVEIAAQFPIGRIGPLLRLAGDGMTVTALSATVRLREPGKTVIWPATVERIGEAIDERTQNAPVVVRVDDPLGQSAPGKRPPLRRNMFVEVELSAPARKALVVPAEAVQNDSALIVAQGDVLEKRKVQVAFSAGGLAVVSGGLAPGERLVVADPSIALPGMAVKPVEDEARKAALAAEAQGEAQGQAQGQPPGAADPAAAPQPGSGGGGGGTGAGKGNGAGKGSAP
ncbi:MAG: efflux RND transporter periplasmic adaptor subunit [Paracoccaceae bacterium]